ncbi:uncharacterized protein EV422DRAFT_564722 [Fimicolochytrium jonesii]|uniref:uncharacterized protein n=1 Tax=Fimicolochytrium jonesii TaxID=1396493 RepID=UPI0022FF1488|nr:uncharacterized protein EV422DRAFT_564722 [Fimicolochytrium jonesii]KAI8824015.1 hypothetical protein EV422DRAFT_564722 [Fimicolochytrium jonesii]
MGKPLPTFPPSPPHCPTHTHHTNHHLACTLHALHRTATSFRRTAQRVPRAVSSGVPIVGFGRDVMSDRPRSGDANVDVTVGGDMDREVAGNEERDRNDARGLIRDVFVMPTLADVEALGPLEVVWPGLIATCPWIPEDVQRAVEERLGTGGGGGGGGTGEAAGISVVEPSAVVVAASAGEGSGTQAQPRVVQEAATGSAAADALVAEGGSSDVDATPTTPQRPSLDATHFMEAFAAFTRDRRRERRERQTDAESGGGEEQRPDNAQATTNEESPRRRRAVGVGANPVVPDPPTEGTIPSAPPLISITTTASPTPDSNTTPTAVSPPSSPPDHPPPTLFYSPASRTYRLDPTDAPPILARDEEPMDDSSSATDSSEESDEDELEDDDHHVSVHMIPMAPDSPASAVREFERLLRTEVSANHDSESASSSSSDDDDDGHFESEIAGGIPDPNFFAFRRPAATTVTVEGSGEAPIVPTESPRYSPTSPNYHAALDLAGGNMAIRLRRNNPDNNDNSEEDDDEDYENIAAAAYNLARRRRQRETERERENRARETRRWGLSRLPRGYTGREGGDGTGPGQSASRSVLASAVASGSGSGSTEQPLTEVKRAMEDLADIFHTVSQTFRLGAHSLSRPTQRQRLVGATTLAYLARGMNDAVRECEVQCEHVGRYMERIAPAATHRYHFRDSQDEQEHDGDVYSYDSSSSSSEESWEEDGDRVVVGDGEPE